MIRMLRYVDKRNGSTNGERHELDDGKCGDEVIHISNVPKIKIKKKVKDD